MGNDEYLDFALFTFNLNFMWKYFSFSAELNVTVTHQYISVPEEDLVLSEFTAGTALNLTCTAQGGRGSLSYSWSVEGNPDTSECPCALPTSNTSILVFKPLFSCYSGTYTCSVREDGRPNSQNNNLYTFSVVGKLLVLLHKSLFG